MDVVLMLFGFVLLVIGGEYLIRASVGLSFKLNLSKMVIGLTVVSFATSFPELLVSLNAALQGAPAIAINNVIGSNIANIFMVMGVLAMVSNITVEQWILDTTLPLLMIVTVAAFGLIRVPFNRISGLLLFAFFILFIYELTII